MSSPNCSTSSSASSNSLINSPSENLRTKDLTELTHQKPEINRELNDCIINEQSVSKFSGYPFDATFIDRMDSQQQPTSRKSRFNGTTGRLRNRRLSQPLMGRASRISKDVTPRKGTKNGVARIVSDFMKKRRTSLPIVPSAGQDPIFQGTTEPNPKRVRKNGSLNNLLSPSLVDADCKKIKISTPRKARKNGIINNVLPDSNYFQPAPKTRDKTSIFEEIEESSPRTRSNRSVSESLTELNLFQTSLQTSAVFEVSKNITPKKTRGNKMVNNNVSDTRSPQDTLQTSVSQVPTTKRTRSFSESVNGIQLDLRLSKNPKESTPRKTKSIGMLNGTFTTDLSLSQPTLQTVAEEPKVSTPAGKRNNGVVNGALFDIKDPKESTPRKTRSIGKINDTLTVCKSSPSTPQRLAQDVSKAQTSKVSTPITKSSVLNGSLSDISLSQPTLQKTAQASKENKRSTPRTTKSTGKMNGILTDIYSPQRNFLLDQEVPVFEEPKDSTEVLIESPLQISDQKSLLEDTKEPKPKRTRKNGKVNGILTDDLSFKSPSQSVTNSSSTEETKKPTPKRRRRDQMLNRILSDYQSTQSTSQTVSQSSISEKTEELTPQTTRKNGIINGILNESHTFQSTSPTVAEEPKESTLKRHNGSINGILDDVKPTESILQTSLYGTPDEKPNADPPEKTPPNGEMRRKSCRTSVLIKAKERVSVVQAPEKIILGNPVVKLERLTFDANGVVIWPSALKGRRVDMQQALEDLERCEEDVQRAKRELYRKYRKPRNGKETYSREYVVERIIDQEFDAETKTLMFRVKWEGYPLELSTWEPLHHLQHCTLLLTQFLAERLGTEVLDALCEKLNISSRLSDQNLLEILKVTDLNCLPDKILLQEKLLRLVATPPKERHVRKLEDGKKAMLMYQLLLRREQQLKKLKAWEDSINGMTKEEALITIENNVDLECPPEGFTYIHENIATNGIVVQSDPERFCECEECGPRQDCCGKQPYNGFTYKTSNKINVNPGNAVYECNKKCKCSQDCRNRVVQNGRKVPLCIFRTSNGCGWGVKAMRKIHCGEFVCEYVGEIITHEEAEVRGRAYDQEGRTYLFDLDYNSKDNPYTVDAAKFGNISHFINHSCDPNLGVYAVWIDCSDPNLPRLALFALREIHRDEEITFDYMMNIDPEVPTTPEKPRFLHTPDKNQVIQNGRNICKCEADACRRYLF